MDPGALVENLVQKHFPKFGTIRKECTYYQTGNSTEDIETGVVSPEIVSTHTNLFIIFDFPNASKMSHQLLDNISILAIDKIAMFPSLDLSITPTVNDIIVDHLSIRWQVISIFSDPQPGLYQLLIRPV